MTIFYVRKVLVITDTSHFKKKEKKGINVLDIINTALVVCSCV